MLAAVAVHQIASRDTPTHQTEIIEHCQLHGLSKSEVGNALDWLVAERLILGKEDCRCPHQRFSAVVLNEVLAIQDDHGRSRITKFVNRILINQDYPLAGLRQLLHELRSPSRRASLEMDRRRQRNPLSGQADAGEHKMENSACSLPWYWSNYWAFRTNGRASLSSRTQTGFLPGFLSLMEVRTDLGTCSTSCLSAMRSSPEELFPLLTRPLLPKHFRQLSQKMPTPSANS